MCQPCVKHVCFIGEVPHLTHGSHMDEARYTHGILLFLHVSFTCFVRNCTIFPAPRTVILSKKQEYEKNDLFIVAFDSSIR